MNISITGSLGSGKTTVCKTLESRGWTIVSTGELFRQVAAERGLTVLELNQALAMSEDSLDEFLDNRITELSKQLDHAVFDSRMAWRFAPNTFKVYLCCPVETAAKRVLNDSRVSEGYSSLAEAITALTTRQEAERTRFVELYGVDYMDVGNFDLIIDTSQKTPDQIADTIEQANRQSNLSI